MMTVQGRSSKIRFIGASTCSLRTWVNPASAANSRRRFSPACAPSGTDDVAVVLENRVRCTRQGRNGVKHSAHWVEVVLDVVGAERFEKQHRAGRRDRRPAQARAPRGSPMSCSESKK